MDANLKMFLISSIVSVVMLGVIKVSGSNVPDWYKLIVMIPLLVAAMTMFVTSIMYVWSL